MEDQSTIYFSDVFKIAPAVLEEYGAFNISLINDLPLFIDPFLLFNSTDPLYQQLHESVIDYLRFLRDKSQAGAVNDGLLEAWFTFREVKENWLGYSLSGNRGSGLGMDFARALNANLASVLGNFGEETVTQGSHLEKVCLIESGVGRDNISDFVTNLLKGFLLEFTQTFALEHVDPAQRLEVPVRKAVFNHKTESWETRRYVLPYVNGEFVLLTPVDLLTKDDVWISKADMYTQFTSVVDAIPNPQLRGQLNNYIAARLTEIQDRDDRDRATQSRRRRRKQSEPTAKQQHEAIGETIARYPQFIDHYIKWKEDHGEEAEAQADARVRSSERLYILQVRELARKLLQDTEFYDLEGSTHDEALQRVAFLKDVIENQGGWRLFYADGVPIRREADLHIIFRLTWCDTPSDISREVDDGRGPADFKVSRGRFDKSIVEFKLAKSSSLGRNLKKQAEAYKAASGAQHAVKVVVFFTAAEEAKARGIIQTLGMADNPDVVLIDARDDNKPSASRL